MCIMEDIEMPDMFSIDAKPCLEIDPVLKGSSSLYIFGTDHNAAQLFFQLCSLRIPIEGFVEENTDQRVTFFHKPVYCEKDLQFKDNIKILITGDEKRKEGFFCKSAAYFNNEIDKDNVVIYGVGRCGRELNQYLKQRNINIKYFIDTNAEKKEEYIDGVPVYGTEILKSTPSETTIIEAGIYWREIDETIRKVNNKLKKRFYIDLPMLKVMISLEKREILVDDESNITIPCSEVIIMASLEKTFPDKRYILYGMNTELLNKYNEVYKMLGYDNFNIATEKNVSEIVRAGQDVLLVQNINQIDELERLGLNAAVDYVPVQTPRMGIGVRRFCFDINLGHSYQYDDDQFGIRTYGEQKADDYKIVVLGNSTTEYGRDSFPSWVEVLYEEYLKKKVTIYNCAVGGYTSTQELIKFLRDGMRLHPNMVLSYSGITDAYFERYHGMSTYSFPYLNKIFHKNLKNPVIANGLPNFDSNVNDWLFNMRSMNAIAEMCGIAFLAFIQPSLGSKQQYTVKEQEIMKMDLVLYSEDVFSVVREFRESAHMMADTYNFIYDLSDIFDFKDVYVDSCHVNIEGQKIIADEIWKRIEKIITKKLSEKDK